MIRLLWGRQAGRKRPVDTSLLYIPAAPFDLYNRESRSIGLRLYVQRDATSWMTPSSSTPAHLRFRVKKGCWTPTIRRSKSVSREILQDNTGDRLPSKASLQASVSFTMLAKLASG